MDWIKAAISSIEGLDQLSNASANITLDAIERVTRGLSDVIEASTQVYPTPTGNTEGSTVVRKAIGQVINALRVQTDKAPGPVTVSSPALNVSVSQAESRTLSFGTSGVANTSIQLPDNLANDLENNKVPITVAMWTTPLDVHGGALNVSRWRRARTLFSYSYF